MSKCQTVGNPIQRFNFGVLQVNCEQKSDCDEENLFACKTSQSSKTQCIWDVYVCDGSTDCEDGSDEVNCTGMFLNLLAGKS